MSNVKLQENARERLRCIQKILPPPSLGVGPLRELFKEQEQERYELRMRHVVEKEKLVLAVEQVSCPKQRKQSYNK